MEPKFGSREAKGFPLPIFFKGKGGTLKKIFFLRNNYSQKSQVTEVLPS